MIERHSLSIDISTGAPRGSGVNSVTSELGAMSIASSTRSISHSNASNIQTQGTNKRGTINTFLPR